jgi:hypothetical protein
MQMDRYHATASSSSSSCKYMVNSCNSAAAAAAHVKAADNTTKLQAAGQGKQCNTSTTERAA